MKKLLSVLLAAALMTATLAACAPKENTSSDPKGGEDPKTSSAAKDPVELKVFGFKTGAEIGALEELIKQFNEENKDIKAVYEGLSNGGGYQDVLTTRLASKQGDDVFMANPNYLGKLQEAGYVLDLSSMGVVSNYSDLVKDLMTIDGKVPGLAMELAAFGMYVNEDLLKEKGIAVPANYKEFMDACEKLKKDGLTPVIASAKDGTGIGVFATSRGMYGLYSASDKMSKIESMNKGELSLAETMKDGLQLVSDLKEKGYINAENALVMGPAQDDITEFAKGKTAFMTGGGWSVAAVKEAAPNMKFSVTGVPVLEDGSAVMVNAGVRLCINNDSKNQDAAKRFVEFMTKTENLDKYVASQNAFTPLKDGKSTDAAAMQQVAKGISEGKMIPWVDPSFQKIDPWSFSKKYAANILGGSSVQDAITEMNTEVKNTLQLS